MTKFTKDPSTHPANGPLTGERLIRVRDELAAAAKRSDGGNLGYMMADAAKVIDELLALRKAEQAPVGYYREATDGDGYYLASTKGPRPGTIPLYAAPQLPQLPQPVEPEITSEELDDELLEQLIDFRRDTLNHHKKEGNKVQTVMHGVVLRAMLELQERRAVMLHGAEPVSQPYTLRDGWVAVPVEPTEDMIIAGFEAELREEFRDPEAWEAFEAMSGCEQAALRAKWCWAAMIAAAPQQEDPQTKK